MYHKKLLYPISFIINFSNLFLSMYVLLFCLSIRANNIPDTHNPLSYENKCLYFRDFFSDVGKRKEIKDLPEHLKKVCDTMGIDPKTIYVFEDETGNGGWAFGDNVILKRTFSKFNNEEQASIFAHELSHIKHKDCMTKKKLNNKIIDFETQSSIVAVFAVGSQIVYKKLKCLPRVLMCSGTWAIANSIASYLYYQQLQKMEHRADFESAKAVGPDAGISWLKKDIFLREYWNDNTIHERVNFFLSQIGFSVHGTNEQRIHLLEQFKKEKSDNEQI